MNKLSAVLFAGVLALHSFGRAGSPPPELNDSQSGNESDAIMLKNKSFFALDQGSRSPFWPIGWKPSPAGAPGAAPRARPEISPSAFIVTSITVEAGGRYAIINGKVMNEGQVFGLQVGKQVELITVKAIQDGQVILAQQDQEIPVPLRRR